MENSKNFLEYWQIPVIWQTTSRLFQQNQLPHLFPKTWKIPTQSCSCLWSILGSWPAQLDQPSLVPSCQTHPVFDVPRSFSKSLSPKKIDWIQEKLSYLWPIHAPTSLLIAPTSFKICVCKPDSVTFGKCPPIASQAARPSPHLILRSRNFRQ